ncbi:MAG: M14 family metallopeptidase [Fimbriimonas sp.]
MRFALFALLVVCAPLASAQSWPTTRAERTNYLETSHHADVLDFLRRLQLAGAPVSVQMMGKSAEGREMPLAIASFPPVASPAEARRLGKPIVFVQANIHAGEVEGKEAIQAVLRRLCQAGPSGLLGKIVLLVAPIYNADGNEKWGPVEKNRPEQDGPPIVGVRANGQGFDLNRDAIKAEAHETQGLLRFVYSTWDPDVMMDLHTTDGTRHGYALTYSPPLNPNTDSAVMKMTRDVILPTIRKASVRPLFDYGNAERRGEIQSWYTFGSEGRYCTNYAGLRNRIAILSEATTYIPFKERVEDTDRFVMSTLEWVASHARRVMETTRGADARVVAWGMDPSKAPALGVRFDFASRGSEEVLLEKAGEKKPITQRPTQIQKVRMEVYDRFKVTKTSKFPAAYLIPGSEEKAVALLRSHGIVVEKLLAPWQGAAEEFVVGEFKQAARPFQGHRLIELNGAFRGANASASAGAYLVRTAQPLGILAFHLLEPESLDGVAAWGFLGESFAVGSVFPVVKLFSGPKVPTERT